MLTNQILNFRLSLRHLGRQKLNTILHIVGLTLGMSVCLLIGLFLRYELSFDTYHKLANRTYRINSSWTNAGKTSYWYSSPLPMAEALRKEVSGLEKVTLAHPQWTTVIEISPDKRFNQDNILIVDTEFPDVFTIEAIKGDVRKALSKPYQALLTESTAKKFFGSEDPIGKTFLFKKDIHVTVAALIRDMPSNTHLRASMLLSYVADEKYLGQGLDSWTFVSGTSTFVVLPEKVDLSTLSAQLKAVADKNINSRQGIPKDFRSDFEIQPLQTVHFDSKYGGSNWVKAVDKSWLWFFASIGLAVLALACINFVNLSTAQAITRAKEIGVRKSVGAGRFNLISHFLREAFILCVTAGVLSVAIVQISLPAVNTLLEKGIPFDLTSSPVLLVSLTGGIIVTSLLAGLYPAWVITKFNPALTLKAGASSSADRGSFWLRKILVVSQFTISAGLLIALLFIAQQVQFVKNRNLGFDKDNIVNVAVPEGQQKRELFGNELNTIPQVKDFSFATATPSNDGHWGTEMSLTNGDDPSRQGVTIIMADDHYAPMYGLKLLSGRFIIPSDTNYISNSIPQENQVLKTVVNETLVRALGFESNEAAIGKRFWCGMNSGKADIVGVVADFNTNSLHESIKPVFIAQLPRVYSQTGIKIESGSDLPETIASIKSAWEKIYPDGVFQFKFLDQQIDDFYKSETRLYTLFKIFAVIAMLISCLGLWGLTAFAAQQRTKEIGIRKVLGASVKTIVVLLSRDFLLMVMIALVIASPLVYYFMKDWLQNFAYKIDIRWWVFAVAGVASVLIALVTVSVQTIRAALSNPVDSLRNE